MHIYAHTNNHNEYSYGNQQADNLANNGLLNLIYFFYDIYI